MAAPRLNALLERHKNSLDFIRFVSAAAVIFSHAYPFAQGEAAQVNDPMVGLTHGQYTTGILAVAIFFMISGFLITASMERSRNAVAYIKARFLRIYPGLIVLVLLTMFVLGLLVTRLSKSDYLRQPETYQYLQTLLLYHVTDHALPGVFVNNVYPSLLNGSLWTLFWEVLCYGLVLALWSIKLLKKRAVLILWIGLLALRFLTQDLSPDLTNPTTYPLYSFLLSTDVFNFLNLASYFFAGVVFYLHREQIVMRRRYAIIGLIALAACMAIGHGLATLWMPIFGAYLLFYAATSARSPFIEFGRYGDFSYGLYIYAPLVQQTIVFLFGGTMQPIVNFVLALPITLIAAVLSWRLVEKPALRLKDRSLKALAKPAIPAVTQT